MSQPFPKDCVVALGRKLKGEMTCLWRIVSESELTQSSGVSRPLAYLPEHMSQGQSSPGSTGTCFACPALPGQHPAFTHAHAQVPFSLLLCTSWEGCGQAWLIHLSSGGALSPLKRAELRLETNQKI